MLSPICRVKEMVSSEWQLLWPGWGQQVETEKLTAQRCPISTHEDLISTRVTPHFLACTCKCMDAVQIKHPEAKNRSRVSNVGGGMNPQTLVSLF